MLITYTYRYGTIAGPSKSYSESGNIKAEGNYFNNHEDGSWREYYESGLLSAEGNYTSGKKSGDWKIYSEDGNLMKTQLYKNGLLIKERVESKCDVLKMSQ
jgi:antitoxin component YwqK of YwqJK toxin-antitoxin module